MSDLPGDDRLRIRPYALTGGRVRSSVDLAIETLVRATPRALEVERLAGERARILELCRRPQSIAEISAHLGLALGVVRVLVGDMVTENLLIAHRTPVGDDRPDLRLLERVLDGLQAL